MNLSDAFRALTPDRKAFLPFIVAGDPDLATTVELIVTLAASGATAVEVGIPFSDPIADGPAIQRASEHALSNGTSVDEVLKACAAARKRVDVPIVLFSYANPLLQYGCDRIAHRAVECGIAAVLLTDVPVEHSAEFTSVFAPANIDLIQLVAPTSSSDRLKKIAQQARGFIYAVSRTGVTGTQPELSRDAAELVAAVRHYTRLPVLLGFGISTPEQFASACRIADGAVVGSALVDLIAAHRTEPASLPIAVRAFVRELRSLESAELPRSASSI